MRVSTLSAWLIPCGLLGILLAACSGGSSGENTPLATDSATIATGKILFNRHCAGCHNFRQDGIGPKLGGITAELSARQIARLIQQPEKLLQSGDTRWADLRKRFKTTMPSFSGLSDQEVHAIVAFLNIHQSRGRTLVEVADKGLADPIPAKIGLSDEVMNLQFVAQIPPSSPTGQPPLARITKLDYSPGSGQLFVNDLRGKLYKLVQGKPVVYMDLARLRPHFVAEPGLATGFGSFAFHPDFRRNGLFYTTHSEAPGSAKADFSYADSIDVTLQWVLTEWKATNPQADTFSGTSRELLRIDFVSGIHGMQEIAFNPRAKAGGPDYGLLYVAVGDGGSVENGYPFLPHNRNHAWGTILRIDPAGRTSRNGQYGIPPTNPFAHGGYHEYLGEIYAYGFRNPHRLTWTHDGRLLVSNVGQHNIEGIYQADPGSDAGWPVREGPFRVNPEGNLDYVYPLPANDSMYHFNYPVAMYDHDEGSAICGGFEYLGPGRPDQFLFGDIPSGRLFGFDLKNSQPATPATIWEWRVSLDGKTRSLKDITGSDRVDLHFGRGSRGELYLLTKADGKIYRITGPGK
ncbi:MAG TPA: PQQ-dependent sugar dehydrogenase [Chitinophagaceae bacterium]|nr:PQQ-dependent sugar dehydrogenase [Chitinophagaceae bacterium]